MLLGLLAMQAQAAPPLDQLTLPKGFHIALYSDQVANARAFALGVKGTVFIGSGEAGKVYRRALRFSVSPPGRHT